MSQKVQGIIIHQIDYKETSKILYIITPYQKISVKALGVKKYQKKLLSTCDILCLNEFIISDKIPFSLVDATLIERYQEIKVDYKKMMCAAVLCEITHLNEFNGFEKKYFQFLVKILNKIKHKDFLRYTLLFLVKVSYLLGVGFSEEEIKKSHIDPTTYNLLKQLYFYNDLQDDIQKIDISYYRNLLVFLKEYYWQHLGLNLKSLKFLIEHSNIAI